MSDYTFDINDDLQVDENYESRPSVKPPTPGNYVFKPAAWGFRKNSAGELVKYKDAQGNPKYPVISLQSVEIVDPIDNARKVVVFQDVPTNPFERDGKIASQAADLLKGFNAEAVARNTGEVIAQVTDALTAGAEFRARLDYRAYDKNYAAELVAALPPGATSKQKNECYRKAEIRGFKRIKQANTQAGHGDLGIAKWMGPSGTIVDVQPYLSVIYAAGEQVQLGPDKNAA